VVVDIKEIASLRGNSWVHSTKWRRDRSRCTSSYSCLVV